MGEISNVFSTPLLSVAGLRPFLPELVELLSSSILSSTPKLVKAAASALFNIARLYLLESTSPAEDDVISIAVAVVEALRSMLSKEPREDNELIRLCVVVLGGFIVLGPREGGALREVLGGVEAKEVLGRFEGREGGEVIGLIAQ